MTEDDNTSTLYGALGTEQFMLQSIASSTISESGTRAAIYLSTLSGGLVAIGFSGSTPGLLAPLAFTVLPTIWLLGCFTIVRLVDTSVANIAVERRIERIRARYATLGSGAQTIFAAEDPLTTGKFGVRYSRWSVLFTVATMIGVVNAVLGGAIVALTFTVGAGLPTVASTCIAVVVGLAILIPTVVYQRKRVGALFDDRSTRRSETATSKDAKTADR
ncbi:MAG: hypothetical protein ABW091_13830 [Microbacterium sp.]